MTREVIEKQIAEYTEQLTQSQQQVILLQGAIQALQNLLASEAKEEVDA